jgi:hypothetical protein
MDDLDAVISGAKAQGFRVTRTKKGHWEFKAPDTRWSPVYASGTTSDWRSVRNLISELRRAGLVWPPAGRSKKHKK